MKDFKSTYVTTIRNEDGVNGVSKVLVPNEKTIEVKHPKEEEVAYNPEQFVGLALVTCLNASIEHQEKIRSLEHKSSVEADVHLVKTKAGLEFYIFVRADIPHVNRELAKEILEAAELACPVAKLMRGSNNIEIELV